MEQLQAESILSQLGIHYEAPENVEELENSFKDDKVTDDIETDVDEDLTDSEDEFKDVPIPTYGDVVTDDVIKATVKESFGDALPEDEAIDFIKLLKEYKEDNTISVYGRLPKTMKGMLLNAVTGGNVLSSSATKPILNQSARDMMDNILSDIDTAQMSADFNADIQKLNEELTGDIRTYGIEQCLKEEEKFRDLHNKAENDKDKELYATLANRIHDAFTLEPIRKAVIENKIKVRKSEIENPKPAFSTFNHMYENTKWKIWDIGMIPEILDKFQMEGVNINKIKWFTVFLAKYLGNMDNKKIEDHVFIYNVINNIIWLRFSETADDVFTSALLKNIKDILDLRY